MNYKKINQIGGWIIFAVAAFVYLSTIEDTVSLWDCGEYITAAYKLEVGHPPGAPLFMMLGRTFSFMVDPENVAQMINSMSALSSAFTILFMYWTISLFTKKIALKDSNRQLSDGQIIAIQGSAFIGALAYTFTDSFWFSAVEGEVYAMSSLFTAIIFWAILKWDEESTQIKLGELTHHKSTNRWIILIMFLFGLAIGVHLLGLLVIPAIAFVIYFNKWEDFNWGRFFLAGFIGIAALGFIQAGVIPGTVALASSMEIFFVNSLGLPINSGAIGFFVLVVLSLVVGLIYSQRKGWPIFNTAILSIVVLLIGYGAFALIVIRSNANPPLDENNPENLVSLHSYLKREQYGSWPIASGQYWNSKVIGSEDRSPTYESMFVVVKNGEDLEGFRSEKSAEAYATKHNGKIVEKYFITNDGKNQIPVYEPSHTTIFPRMFSNQKEQKVNGYKRWSGYSAHGQGYAAPPEIPTADGKRLPTFGENLQFFTSYQMGWMYFRYFFWNFAGRQNDIQGHGDAMQGNWQSGVAFIDSQRIGDQSNAPAFTTSNPSNNAFFLLPLILGLIGVIFHFYKAPKDAFIVALLFLFTGIAIIIYLNPKPYEPRERDYAYAASFYFFAIWIGVSVYALFDVFRSLKWKELKTGAIGAGLILGCFWIADLVGGDGFAGSLSWLYITFISAIMVGVMYLLKGKTSEKTGAFVAIALTIATPIIMGMQGWDDHDRGNRTIALDLAKNYLGSCEPNSILFTGGDNDTFPLWYLQEVEEKYTSVRVCNLSLLQTDWYTEQMTMKAYDSEPLPISMTPDQMVSVKGKTNVVYISPSYYQLATDFSTALADSIFAMKIKYNQRNFNMGYKRAAMNLARIIAATPVGKSNPKIIETLTTPVEKPGIKAFTQFFQISLELLQNASKIGLTENLANQLQQNITSLEELIDYLPIKYAVSFALNDKNMITKTNGMTSNQLRVFPCAGFIIPVNDKQALVKNGVVRKDMLDKVADEVRFKFTTGAIYHDEVVMMDILSNFNWERNIYFSSPYGSNLGKALLNAGYISMEGTVYKFTPMKNVQVNRAQLYANLMKNYRYGNMGGEGILVDYYSRRHATQYRHQFYVLATQYAQDYLRAKNRNNILSSDTTQALVSNDKEIKEARKKVIEIVEKAMESIPLENVIDFGEPSSQKRQAPNNPADYTYVYNDGSTQELVALLYRVDAPKKAAALGEKVAKRLESIMDFVLDSPISISSGLSTYFFAALDNYSTMFAVSPDTPDAFAKHMENYIKNIQPRFNQMMEKMKRADAGQIRGERAYQEVMNDYLDRMKHMPLFAAK